MQQGVLITLHQISSMKLATYDVLLEEILKILLGGVDIRI